MNSNRKPGCNNLIFVASGLIVVILLITLTVGLSVANGVLQFHSSSVSLDAPVWRWRIGGYVALDPCGSTIHYGFNGPNLPTTGDGLIVDLWCVHAIVRQSDQHVLLSW